MDKKVIVRIVCCILGGLMLLGGIALIVSGFVSGCQITA